MQTCRPPSLRLQWLSTPSVGCRECALFFYDFPDDVQPGPIADVFLKNRAPAGLDSLYKSEHRHSVPAFDSLLKTNDARADPRSVCDDDCSESCDDPRVVIEPTC